ncbi:succinate dehydrogenase cytochrome b subunit [Methylacidiphilum caldifontis]|uniref:succinate dehydrogenase cytochrome b subunit n=1 Tax=Methylacidiphilum caldifontis TaxID=2795386 RepID=UPI001A8E7C2C|nr:succinate dehydrogenase cytochrome b subunit [Methylacidiphilum caldifontis]QSR88309.1 succinate dehydrogenase cytochrome b subunit [Methylacidiphilum caldifontis]
MTQPPRSYSTIGLKILMGSSGLILFLFLIVHMLGNWQVFLPPYYMNTYAYFLKSKPAVLWSIRLFLLMALVVHVISAIRLWKINRQARPQPYALLLPNQASFESRTMIFSGLVILSFILFHLYHFTFKAPPFGYFKNFLYQFEKSQVSIPDVRAMVIAGFQNPWVTLFYILSLTILYFHLRHALESFLNSLGFVNSKSLPWERIVAHAFALVVYGGFLIVPLAVFLRLVH